MSFWTVEDAGPYKEKSNFLMRTSLFAYLGSYSHIRLTGLCAFTEWTIPTRI